MSRRSILRPYRLFQNEDSTSNPSSAGTSVSGLDNIMHLIEVDAGVSGELFVEFSLDDRDPSNWKKLAFGESLIIDGATETVYSTNIKNPGFNFMRLRFVDNSGVGNINAWISGNTVGA